MAGLREALGSQSRNKDNLDVEVRNDEYFRDNEIVKSHFCVKNDLRDKPRLRFLFGPGVSFDPNNRNKQI